ncbi:MAG: AMP-binding protein [Nevskia sp.]|nr:AMP-binding protein [Nevskia sp.]
MGSMNLSYACGISEVPLLGQTIGENLEQTAMLHGGTDALVDVQGGRRWTYAQFNAAVDTVAAALLGRGLAKGDRIGIWSPNCPEWVLVQYAAAKLGAILVNINPAYRSSELEFVLRQSQTRVLVSAAANRGTDCKAMVESLRGGLPELEDVIYIGDPTWEKLYQGGVGADLQPLRARMRELSFDDPVNIQYTSGTTGAPKGATLSHHSILNNGFFVAELLGVTERDRMCLPVPFYHCFGMVMGNLGATTHGAAIVIPAPNFDARSTLAAVQAERCTVLYGVPTMFIAELALPDFTAFELGSLRTGIMAGSPCPVDVMRRVMEQMHMREVSIAYGMTETSPVSTQTRRDDDIERRTATVGCVMPHVEVKIVDPATGLTLPRGAMGELCTRGYSVMRGYWREPQKTAEVIDAARWMHTGDLATMRPDGYVNIVGRIKDMVIRGGENIYPREVEEFLYGHPDILDVQVIGVPDEKYGEELMACVRLREGAAALTDADVREFCHERLAHYKIPRYVRVVESFPMTVTGKVRKVELREQAAEWVTQRKS